MSIYAIGDPHLSFSPNVDKPMDIFGEEWKDHTEKIKKSWLSCVKDDDTVVIAGDISWGLKMDEAMADLEWIDALPGKKVMLKGNHDLWWASISRLNSLFDDMFFIQNTSYVCEDAVICGTRGWSCPGSDDFTEADRKIYDREVLRLGYSLESARQTGLEIIAFTHFPPTNDKKQPSGFTRLYEQYGVRYAYYGHLHRKETFKRGITGNLNGVNYTLISADKLGFQLLKIR
jgi:predicted phosphohydrolase